ncbi:MAG: hypothetical protein E6K18_07365 [Methanobacteriota archaeon]|nr:MAG: hypothetical protein E6K18_07365 [Euryarchaeota archaeon]
MHFRFVVDGAAYSRHKAAFKKMLADHRLAWRGNMTEFVWVGPKERVRAEYERDEARGITIKAMLIWEGKAKTPLLNELKTWVFAVGGKAEEQKATKVDKAAVKERVDREMEFWDRVHKPDVDALRADGRPEEWIEKDLKEWKKARDARRKELSAAQ